MSSIFTKELCKRLANLTMEQVAKVKLIVNDVAQDAVILKKEIVNDTSLWIYISLSLNQDDILNGIELYDSSNVLLAKTQINLNYMIQRATYLFKIDFYSDNIISNFSFLGVDNGL